MRGRLATRATLPRDGARLEGELRRLVAALLAVPSAEVDPHQPLSTLGLDSLKVVELQSHLSTRFGLDLDPGAFFGELTIAGVAELIRANRAG